MKKTTFPRYLLLCVLFIAVITVFAQLTVPPSTVMAQRPTIIPTLASNTSIIVIPSSTTVNPGDSFDIAIEMTSDVPTWGIQLQVAYDPKLIEIVSTEEGGFYQEWASQNGAESITLPSPAPDNQKGVISTFAIVVMGATPGEGPMGTGNIIVLKAIAKSDASGSTNITLSDIQISDSAVNDGYVTEVGGVVIQNATVAIGLDASSPQQPAQLASEGLIEKTTLPSVNDNIEPTIERRVPSTAASSSGIPWEIALPVAGALLVGVIFFLTLKNRK
jgi:hypothetical protein